ncbi:hypothetical protein C8Q74DRAFT_843032 [Fomes fomentarius]|nr:hypothetical protein C8Q74DRAFT_843032 [Fomes fomentarius]
MPDVTQRARTVLRERCQEWQSLAHAQRKSKGVSHKVRNCDSYTVIVMPRGQITTQACGPIASPPFSRPDRRPEDQTSKRTFRHSDTQTSRRPRVTVHSQEARSPPARSRTQTSWCCSQSATPFVASPRPAGVMGPPHGGSPHLRGAGKRTVGRP